MAFVVDTNVLVAAYDRASPAHRRAKSGLREWLHGTGRCYLTWPIVYEFLQVVTHPAVFRRPATLAQAWAYVRAVLGSPCAGLLTNTDRHAAVVEELIDECPWAAGGLMHDFHTVALMREHGVKEIRTADSDFLKFRFLRVVDPLRE